MNSQESACTYVGLIGWPVEHSLSPAMHNAAFAALGLPWKYLLLPTPPSGLKRAIRGLKAKEWAGANVTIPYKEAVIPHLDCLSPEAGSIGAVNTIVVQAGRCVGHNTDGTGFLRTLSDQGFEPRGKRAMVLGAGGAARAVVHALLRMGAEVVICNRTLARAEALALSLSGSFDTSSLTVCPLTSAVLEEEIGRCHLLVNATSAGMPPQSQLSPWPDEVPIPAEMLVYDLVYAFPRETPLLRRAKAAGAHTMDGLQMLVQQGIEAFRLWTGILPPREVFCKAISDTPCSQTGVEEEECCAS